MSKSELVKSGSKTSVTLEPEVAIAIIGLFSASDEDEGIISTEEGPLPEILEGIELFENYSDEDFDELTAKVNTVIKEQELNSLIPAAIASLTKKSDRETAYIAAILNVGMEEDMPESEEDYIFKIQKVFKISDDRAGELIDEVFEEYEEEEEEEE
ncbi:MAG: hypothetical protein EAZ77_11530 [Nostocales cyanobacterium]|nr:MAG: hypothetical protein EAZ77_11530 [Nostocales cyanobacterium]